MNEERVGQVLLIPTLSFPRLLNVPLLQEGNNGRTRDPRDPRRFGKESRASPTLPYTRC